MRADVGLAQAGTTLQKESLFGRCLALGMLLLGGVGRWKTYSWAVASTRPSPADTSTSVQSPHHQAEVKLLTRCYSRCAPSVEGPVLCALAGMKGKSLPPGLTPCLCVSGCRQGGGLCHVGRSQVRTALSGCDPRVQTVMRRGAQRQRQSVACVLFAAGGGVLSSRPARSSASLLTRQTGPRGVRSGCSCPKG